MKKILIGFAIFLAFPFLALATVTQWDYAGGILQPLQSQWSAVVKGSYFHATSTTASIFPYASTTAISVSSLTSGNCVQAGLGGLLTTIGLPCGVASFGQTWEITSGYLHPTTTIPVLIGATTPPADILSNDLLRVQGSSNDFLDIGIENTSTGVCATSEFDALNNLTTLTNHFSAFGHTGGSFTGSGCANVPYTDFGADSTYIVNPNGDVNFGLGTTSSAGAYKWFGAGYGNTNRLMTLTQPGRIGLGTNNPDSQITISSVGATTAIVAPQNGTMIHLASSGAANARITGDVYTNGTTQGFVFQGRKSRGGVGSPTAVNANDTLALLGGVGYGTTGFPNISAGAYVIRAEESGSDTSQPTYLAMFTTPTGTITPTERMRISSAGLVGIGSSTPGTLLSIGGNATGINFVDGTTATSTFSGHVRIKGNLQVDGKFFAPVTLVSSGDATINGNLTVTGSTFLATASGNVGIGTASATHKLDILGGTLSAGQSVFNATATLNSGGGAEVASSLIITSAGSAGNQTGFISTLNAGYTGNGLVTALSGQNLVAGTGGDFTSAGNYNAGVFGQARGTTIGDNIGVQGVARGGNISIGLSGKAVVPVVGTNIGNASYAANSSGTAIGAYFFLGNTKPLIASTSAALIANNGSVAGPIFIGLDNSVEKFRIDDGGNVGIGTSSPAQLLSVGNAFTSGGLYYSTVGLAVGSSTPAFPFSVTPVLSNLASTFYINSSGAVVAYDSVNGWSGVIGPTHRGAFSIATSTATWTATSTPGVDSTPFVPLDFKGTLRSITCNFNTFLGVNIKISGSSVSPSYFVASSTQGVVLFTGSNTFTKGQTLQWYAGTTTSATAASGVVNGSCTIDMTESL